MSLVDCFDLRLTDFDKLIAALYQGRVLLTLILTSISGVQAVDPPYTIFPSMQVSTTFWSSSEVYISITLLLPSTVLAG